MRSYFGIAVVSIALVSGIVRADPQSDARALKDESLKILKDIANRDATPEELAKCIFNLEKAAAILEVAKDTESDLATEVNSQLYWARKRSTLAMDAVLNKLHADAGFKPPAPEVAKKAETPKPQPQSPEVEVPAGLQPQEAPAKAFKDAEKFAASHAGDDYTVGINWFKMASMYPGTDHSMKALTLAREAQARFQSKNAPVKKEEVPETPETKSVADADAMAAGKQYDKAVALYLAAIKIKDSAPARRNLGKAYYDQAQAKRDELLPKKAELWTSYQAAVAAAYVESRTLSGAIIKRFNPRDPGYQKSLADCRQLGREMQAVYALYDKAKDEFKWAVKLAPKNKDLVSAGLIGICQAQRPESMMSGRSVLLTFIKEYTPANDDERTIYEYCKTELDRLNNPAKGK